MFTVDKRNADQMQAENCTSTAITSSCHKGPILY